jgi:predicted acetyltransferase
MSFRPLMPDTDLEDVMRIWREIGWLQEREDAQEVMELFLNASSHGWVAELDGHAECLVTTMDGQVHHQDKPLPFSVIAAVTTSRVARKQGLATGLTAHALAHAASEGAAVAGLGMFEQGFYNRLGFGTGTVEHCYQFAPQQLRVPKIGRRVRRIEPDQWRQIHACRTGRLKRHGAINLSDPLTTRSEIVAFKGSFGLGFFDGANGELSHHIWLRPVDGGVMEGPYMVMWPAYETYEQFVELLSVLKSLDDQVHKLVFIEPPGICLQDFLKKPTHYQQITENSAFQIGARASAFWQVRICDLAACLAQTSLPGAQDLTFNLSLYDPVEELLPNDEKWRGISGDYTLSLGQNSSARSGLREGLPHLRASVSAFSRLWFGVLPATTLAISEDLSGPPQLLQQLDRAFCLPTPHVDWDI